MKALSAKYEKPYQGRPPEYAPETLWQFTVETDEMMPHQHKAFGGLLRKHAETGMWQARHYENTSWGEPAADRLAAIQNIIPAVIESITAHRQRMAGEEKERYERSGKSKQLSGFFPAGWSVSDDNGWHVDRESSYTISIKGLSEENVRQIARMFNASEAK